MIPRRLESVLACVVLLLVAPAGAADRPDVFVEFALQVYTDEFEDVDALNVEAAGVLAERLQEKIRFVTFRTGPPEDASGTPDPYRLRFELKALEPASGTQLREVGLFIQLLGPDVPEKAKSYWMLLPASEWRKPAPDKQAILDGIGLRTREATTAEVVDAVLAFVPIASESAISENPPGWELPYDKKDLCIDTNSRLRFTHGVRFPQRELQREFEATLSGIDDTFCEPLTNLERFDELLDPELPNRVLGIYVLHYVFLEECLDTREAVPPGEADLGALGGGS